MRTSPTFFPRVRFSLAAVIGIIIYVFSLGVAQESLRTPGHKQSAYAALAEAPEKARVRRNPFEDDPEAIAAGGKLFEQHCAECHGRKAGGTRHGPSLLSAEVQRATDGTLFWVVTNGVVWHGMPVWSKLPEPERWQVVTYLRSLNPKGTKSAP